VIGLGAIGGNVANATSALGMHVIGYDPALTWKVLPSCLPACGAWTRSRRCLPRRNS
jgi:hypothetical protein